MLLTVKNSRMDGIDENSREFQEAMREQAKYLGMDPDKDKDLLWIGGIFAP